MKRKKILALLAVGALLAGTLTGCGGGDAASGDAGSAGDSQGAAEGDGAQADSGDDTSPITFEYYNADGKNGNWSETPVGAAITEATGVTLEITYPVSSTGDASEDVALMIANDDYPDMIYSKAAVTNLYEAGALIDMTDLIEQYGPNIKKMYGDEFEKLKWGADDPGIYQLSYAGVRGKIFSTGGTCQIQYAVLAENDYKYPTTLAEYEEILSLIHI